METPTHTQTPTQAPTETPTKTEMLVAPVQSHTIDLAQPTLSQGSSTDSGGMKQKNVKSTMVASNIAYPHRSNAGVLDSSPWNDWFDTMNRRPVFIVPTVCTRYDAPFLYTSLPQPTSGSQIVPRNAFFQRIKRIFERALLRFNDLHKK